MDGGKVNEELILVAETNLNQDIQQEVVQELHPPPQQTTIPPEFESRLLERQPTPVTKKESLVNFAAIAMEESAEEAGERSESELEDEVKSARNGGGLRDKWHKIRK